MTEVQPDQKTPRTMTRQECREIVLSRAGHRCEVAPYVPEIECGRRPGRLNLEVDEIRGGSFRCTEQYDPDRCRAVCPAHHDYLTLHKKAVNLAMYGSEWGPLEDGAA